MRPARPNRRFELALAIDRLVGPVLCALLVAIKGLRRVRPSIPPEEVSRVLLVKLWGMGSIVLSSALFPELKRRYPEARIDFLSLGENQALLDLYPEVDRQITLDLSRGILPFLFGTLGIIWRIRRERYDLLLDLEFFTRFSAILSFLAGARHSHGFSSKGSSRGLLHDTEVPFNTYRHVVVNFLTLLRGDPIDVPIRADAEEPGLLPRLGAPADADHSCQEKLAAQAAWRDDRPLVVVNPNAGDMALERRWPQDRIVEFLDGLAVRDYVNVVLTGSLSEREYVESLVRRLARPQSVMNLAGHLSIPELVSLLGAADVVVTNDSGPLHLAAAAGASSVALFGPETPALYAPLRIDDDQRHRVHYLQLPCSPCMFVHNNKVVACWFAQARCMAGIRAGDVVASVESILAASRSEAAPGLRAVDS